MDVLKFIHLLMASRREPQRKADESRAQATLFPRARLGIDVAPQSCPVKERSQ